MFLPSNFKITSDVLIIDHSYTNWYLKKKNAHRHITCGEMKEEVFANQSRPFKISLSQNQLTVPDRIPSGSGSALQDYTKRKAMINFSEGLCKLEMRCFRVTRFLLE